MLSLTPSASLLSSRLAGILREAVEGVGLAYTRRGIVQLRLAAEATKPAARSDDISSGDGERAAASPTLVVLWIGLD